MGTVYCSLKNAELVLFAYKMREDKIVSGGFGSMRNQEITVWRHDDYFNFIEGEVLVP